MCGHCSGSFAEAQATYLNPDKGIIKELDRVLADRRVGIVAHYYMDPELQVGGGCALWSGLSRLRTVGKS
jgi:quinolinate synthase